jgi:tRNA-modifying protein YgfZ
MGNIVPESGSDPAGLARAAIVHMPDLVITPLEDLSVLSVRGPDARTFLQGQVSNDLDLLDEKPAMLAGLHNAQGRCLAVLRLLLLDAEQALVILPADLAGSIAAHLTKFVLRARVKINDASSQWRTYGAAGPDAEAAASTRLGIPMDASGLRQMMVAPRAEPLPDADRQPRSGWRLDDIAAGLAEINAATCGKFTAQMLNLDLIGAVSFSKGCYTGQEIIARAHYLGQVKRRMLRFHVDSDLDLQPGLRVSLGDGRRAQVVMCSAAEGGGQEFLAVTTPVAGALAEEEYAATGARLDALQLPLPYALSS